MAAWEDAKNGLPVSTARLIFQRKCESEIQVLSYEKGYCKRRKWKRRWKRNWQGQNGHTIKKCMPSLSQCHTSYCYVVTMRTSSICKCTLLPWDTKTVCTIIPWMAENEHDDGSPLSLKCPANPYFLTFVWGNISRCAGCGTQNLRSPNGKPHAPPEDLCL